MPKGIYSRKRTPALVRFIRMTKPEGKCVVWTGNKRTGYGLFYPSGNICRSAHRFAYEMFRGPIPVGAQLHHVCENKRCVDPWHLEPVTAREHIERTPNNFALMNSQKTHCKHGHEFTPENTYTFRGMRQCKKCHHRLSLEWWERKRITPGQANLEEPKERSK